MNEADKTILAAKDLTTIDGAIKMEEQRNLSVLEDADDFVAAGKTGSNVVTSVPVLAEDSRNQEQKSASLETSNSSEKEGEGSRACYSTVTKMVDISGQVNKKRSVKVGFTVS